MNAVGIKQEKKRSMKHLSSKANDVILRCVQILGTSEQDSLTEFQSEWKPETGDYSRKFLEFCCSKALNEECKFIGERISDGSFSKFTFDMMLAWEAPSVGDEEAVKEHVGKEKEDKKIPAKVDEEHADVSLFYTDIMPLLANEGPSVGEDAVIWLASLVPLVVDSVNGRFTYETLTAPAGHRLFFPAYDSFLKEIDKCIKRLQTKENPRGVELSDDEFILHVDGTSSTQRVIRHIGVTSWPGRLTLTNYALYFEASGAITYEDAIKIDLSKDVERSVKPASTGPWGAPLFDKAISYESGDLMEPIVLEFPEVTSSTRRDHWLALVKEIILLHKFLTNHKVDCPIQAWETHARTIVGIVRLHGARELLRISPPPPTKFLIFTLYDELPKGDYVLQELVDGLKNFKIGNSCSASSILRSMNLRQSFVCDVQAREVNKGSMETSDKGDFHSSLQSTINQVREEAKEIAEAKATTEGIKEEGISESVAILMELLKPLKGVVPLSGEIISWEKPATTSMVIVVTVVIIYKEWIGKAIATGLLWLVSRMLKNRQGRAPNSCKEIVVSKATDQKSTIESIISAQVGLKTIHEIMKEANVVLLRVWSLICAKAHKHTDMVIATLSVLAIILAVIPLKYILMAITLHCFVMTSKLGKYLRNNKGNRRIKEWWESIPAIPVRIEDSPQSPT